MAITSPEAFLNALIKSKLLTAEQLTQAQDTVLLTSKAEEFSEILVDEGLLTEWQASQLMAGSTGFRIGNYVLLDMLGRGGMGSVYLARHTTMKRQVALKVISRRVGKDPASLERFLTEARATASLDHPNIVRAYDVDQDKERFFIVMEYVAGRDLQEFVDTEGPLEFEFLVDCIRQAAEGLAHAHRRNMVHCDIKPSNLLVNQAGTVKILDMGMARLLNESAEDSSATRDERVLGTVDYMAPEQAMDGPDFDHRADIYSLGCTMYFLLTGHPPFDEGTLSQRIVRHQTQVPPDIRAEHPDAPPELVEICLKMMAKSPDDRYQSADEVVEVLKAWHPREPVPAGSEPPPVRTSTGVAIDEEEFKAAPPLKKIVTPPKPKSFWEDERRVIFWIATVAICLGGLLLITVLILTGGSSDEMESARAVVQGTGKTDENSEKVPPEETTPREKPGNGQQPRQVTPDVKRPVEVSPRQAAAQSTEPAAGSGQQGAKANRKNGKNRKRPAPPTRSQMPTHSTTAPGPAVSTSSGGLASTTSVQLDPGGGPLPLLPGVEADRPKPQAQPQTQTPPKPKSPLQGLAAAVELPPLSDGSGSVSLGAIDANATKGLQLALLGGDLAVKGDARFALVAQPDQATWLVQLIDGAAKDANIAKLSLLDKEIRLEWLGAAEGTAADSLKNCLLEVKAGNYEQVVRLAKPQPMDSLTLRLEEGSAQVRFPLDQPAKAEAMQLEITAVDGLPGKSRLKKAVSLEAGQRKDIPLVERDGCSIELRVEYARRGDVGHLEVSAYYRLASWQKLSKFSPRQMGALARQQTFLKNRVGRLSRAPTARMSDEEIKAQKQKLRKAEAELAWIEQLVTWLQGTENAIQIQFREYLVVDGHRVLLLDTRASGSAAPSAPPPSTRPGQPMPSGEVGPTAPSSQIVPTGDRLP